MVSTLTGAAFGGAALTCRSNEAIKSNVCQYSQPGFQPTASAMQPVAQSAFNLQYRNIYRLQVRWSANASRPQNSRICPIKSASEEYATRRRPCPSIIHSPPKKLARLMKTLAASCELLISTDETVHMTAAGAPRASGRGLSERLTAGGGGGHRSSPFSVIRAPRTASSLGSIWKWSLTFVVKGPIDSRNLEMLLLQADGGVSVGVPSPCSHLRTAES